MRSNHSPTWSYKPIRGMRVQEPNWTWTSSDAVSRGGSSGREVTGESEAQSQVTAWEVQFTPKSTKKPEEPSPPALCGFKGLPCPQFTWAPLQSQGIAVSIVSAELSLRKQFSHNQGSSLGSWAFLKPCCYAHSATRVIER